MLLDSVPLEVCTRGDPVQFSRRIPYALRLRSQQYDDIMITFGISAGDDVYSHRVYIKLSQHRDDEHTSYISADVRRLPLSFESSDDTDTDTDSDTDSYTDTDSDEDSPYPTAWVAVSAAPHHPSCCDSSRSSDESNNTPSKHCFEGEEEPSNSYNSSHKALSPAPYSAHYPCRCNIGHPSSRGNSTRVRDHNFGSRHPANAGRITNPSSSNPETSTVGTNQQSGSPETGNAPVNHPSTSSSATNRVNE